MLGFGKRKNVTKWQEWKAACDAKSDEVGDVRGNIHRLEREVKQTREDARWKAREVLKIIDFPLSNTPASDIPSAHEVVKKVGQQLRVQKQNRDNGRRFEWNLREVEAALENLKPLVEKLDQLDAQLEAERPKYPPLQEELDKLEANRPALTLADLKAFDSDLDSLDGDIQRIDLALEGISDAEDLVARAQAEAARAQAQLDDLEATATLGEVSEEDHRKASSTLRQAEEEVQKARDQASRQESARRGLERKRTELAERREELGRKRADIAIEVYRETIANAEERLIKALESDEIQSVVEEINSARRLYNKATNHGKTLSPDYSPLDKLKVEFEFNYLVFHPEKKKLNNIGIKL